MKIRIINGPNLNMLGSREAGFYGNFSLQDLEKDLRKQAEKKAELVFFQSNHEGEIIQAIHQAKEDGIIINAASLTHTSIGIRDALLAVKIPFVEVHISNVFSREEFRHHSYLSDISAGVIVGFGRHRYSLALHYFLQLKD